MNLMFSVLFFFVSNVHIYIKYLVILPFEVGEKGMRCFSVPVRFLRYFFSLRKSILPCLGGESGGCYVLPTSAALALQVGGGVFPPENPLQNLNAFSVGGKKKTNPKKFLPRGGRRMRETHLVNTYLFTVAGAARRCLFSELAGKRRLFCSVVVIAVPVRSILRFQN